MEVIIISFTTAHDDVTPVRTKEQLRKINGVRSTTNDCMERFTEQKCLRALFDNEYFWHWSFYWNKYYSLYWVNRSVIFKKLHFKIWVYQMKSEVRKYYLKIGKFQHFNGSSNSSIPASSGRESRKSPDMLSPLVGVFAKKNEECDKW